MPSLFTGSRFAGKGPARSVAGLLDRRAEAVMRGNGFDEALRTEIAHLRREVESLRNGQRSIEVLLSSTGRGSARLPSPAQLSELARQTAAVTGDADGARRDIACAFRLLVSLEALGVGRVAGGTMNICGKLATIAGLAAPNRPDADAAPVPNDDVLEIGTLFGLFAAALVRMLERTGRAPQLTVVDPLIGVQRQPGARMNGEPSGTPVTEAAVRTNLALAGAAGVAARIHQGFSGDPDVRRAAADRPYGVIVVDGDHSQEGVAADLEWVEDLAAPGGIVVLDDYGDPKWQGVQAALDAHLATGTSRLTLLGQVATSGFLRAG